jgi:5-hydroxyisourate hydrolase-like protein (transthyretin family)
LEQIMIEVSKRTLACFLVLAGFAVASPAMAEMRITEYMYSGTNGEFIEFTNVGSTPVDMTGWSFDDDSETTGTVDLSAFGVVAAGESVILTETAAADFRTAWSLCDAVKVIGGNTTNLGRDDEINLFDASGQLADRLKYGDDTLGGPRTQNASAWVSADGLGANVITDWTLSSVGDTESSYASAGGDIGSPGKSTRATVPFTACPVLAGAMRITEYMYSGANGEFIEFTNVGNASLDLTGWSFSDSAESPGAVDLGAYGTVHAGESVILTETVESDFRTAWNLCDGIKIIGGNTVNLGRADEINIYDATSTLIDRLTYNDQTLGGPRTQNASAWVSADGLGANNVLDWTLSSVADGESSYASTGADIGSPGKSTRATVVFDPCVGTVEAPKVTVDPAATSMFLDLTPAGSGTASGVIDDPTDPAATDGIGFAFALPGGGDPSTLTIVADSGNADVVDASGLNLTGTGAARQLQIVPRGVGYATITVSATDTANNTGTYVINYAASEAPALPDATRYHTGASDASATEAVDDQTMFVADDETNTLRLYRRDQSGLPINGFDFSAELNLTDPDNPELDLEGSARIDDRLFWTASFSNSKNFHVRPNRHRVFATDLAGTGDDATLSYVGRYDWLLEDLVAWDENNGHGLGANYLGFAASSAEGVDSKTPEGFNIEGLAMAPDNSTAYFAFRAPLLPTNDRHQAVIVPVLNFAAVITGAAPDSLPQGSATLGAPIFLELGGRGIRSLDRNAAGQYLITAGPTGDATGIAPDDFRLYAWTGNPLDAPFDLGLDMTSLDVADGSFESIAGLPDDLGAGTELQFLLDNGDTTWYGDGIAAKDLPDPRLKKAASLRVTVNVAFPAASVATDCCTPQSAPVHEAFALPLSAHVTDAYGHGVSNVMVTFAAPTDGASATLSATTMSTDANGFASVTAAANAIAGSYSVVASVKGVATNASFELTNTPGAPTAIAATGGTPQSTSVTQPFANALAVHVTDADGNAVAGANVQFAAPASDASANLSSASAMTDGDGNASVDATANAIAGGYAVVASVGGAQATFALTNVAGPAAAIAVTSGTPQSAIVNHVFVMPLAVHVTDAEGNAVSGANVTFTPPAEGASAVLSATTVNTDANGDASVTATANAVVGTYSVSATVNGVNTGATFELTNTIDGAEVIFANGFD